MAGLGALGALLSGGTILDALSQLVERCGEPLRLRLMGFDAVVAAGPENVRRVLLDPGGRLSCRLKDDPVVGLCGRGLLVVDGELHRNLRRLSEPYLRGDRLEGYAGSVLSRVDRLVAGWPRRGQVELMGELRRLTLEILLEALFGLDPEPAETLERGTRAAGDYIGPGPWLLGLRLPNPRLAGRVRPLEEYVREQVRNRRLKPHGDNLLTAWARCPWLSDELIRDQLMTFLVAGHETVAAWLGWILGLVLSEAGLAERLRAEVLDGLGERSEPDPEGLRRLSLLEAVGREALRLWPPIPILNRRAVGPVGLSGGLVRPGGRVLVGLYALHRRGHLWPEPQKFRPERFLGSRPGMPFAYLPFGAGPHTCIGAAFARLEGGLVLARLLQRVRLRPAFGRLRPRVGATLEPAGPLFVEVERVW